MSEIIQQSHNVVKRFVWWVATVLARVPKVKSQVHHLNACDPSSTANDFRVVQSAADDSLHNGYHTSQVQSLSSSNYNPKEATY